MKHSGWPAAVVVVAFLGVVGAVAVAAVVEHRWHTSGWGLLVAAILGLAGGAATGFVAGALPLRKRVEGITKDLSEVKDRLDSAVELLRQGRR